MKVSNSEIQAFKRCRRKWWLQYHRGLAPIRPEVAGPRSLGTRVHAALADYYAPGARDVATAMVSHDAIVADDLLRTPDSQSDIIKEANLSKIILEGYFEWLEETGADAGLAVVAPEQEVSVEFGSYTVTGKLDLRVRWSGPAGDRDAFLDHKTVQEFTTPTRTLHLDEQMLMYMWLCWRSTGDVVDHATYNMLRKVKRTAAAKPPFYERFDVRHTLQELESFERRLAATLEEMDRLRKRLNGGVDPLIAYPTPTRNCSWDCDFFAVCPLVDRPDLGGGEGLIETMYEKVDPYARYVEAAGELS